MPTPTDTYALAAIRDRRVFVDPDTGVITRPDGTRAEVLRGDGSGRVQVWRHPVRYAPAHRVVWLAVHGEIPPHAAIVHADGIRSHNAITNLRVSHRWGFVSYTVAL